MPIKKLDAFDLEQAIMEVWHTKEDIENLYHRMDKMTEDQRMNYLLGLMEIHEARANKVFDIYETLLSEGKLKYGEG
jgi:hypothetical protein